MGSRYLKTENQKLKELYPTAPKEIILKFFPNKDWSAISAHARIHGLHRTMATKGREIQAGLKKENHYTEEENQVIRAMYPNAMQAEIMALFPTRTWVGISIHALKLGVRRTMDARGKAIQIAKKKNDKQNNL